MIEFSMTALEITTMVTVSMLCFYFVAILALFLMSSLKRIIEKV